jgi:hypothetical protein
LAKPGNLKFCLLIYRFPQSPTFAAGEAAAESCRAANAPLADIQCPKPIADEGGLRHVFVMMKAIISHCVAAVAGGLLAFAVAQHFSQRRDRVVTSEFWPSEVSDTRLTAEAKRALQGDKRSSANIVIRISDCATVEQVYDRKSTECTAQQRYWLNIDAENGGSYGMSVRFNELSYSERCADRIRSLFWASKLISVADREGVFSKERERISRTMAAC